MSVAWVACLAACLADGEQQVRLQNGLRAILIPRDDYPVVAVALGVEAGVYNEPEGRNGLAHLAEHAFWYAASRSYAPHQAFETLARGGPLGAAFQDCNAETLWNLTYFYAARPADSFDLALQVFAEKLGGVEVSPELLDAERAKVLEEIEYATSMTRSRPALQKQLEQLARYPKAGTASHVQALGAADVRQFLAANYRPDRVIVVMIGRFEVEPARARIEELFGTLPNNAAAGLEDARGADIAPQVVATASFERATDRDAAALRVAGARWEKRLRQHGRAYVEVVPGKLMRAVLIGHESEVLQSSLVEIVQSLDDETLPPARRAAAQRAAQYKFFLAQYAAAPKPPDQKAFSRAILQTAIDRLRLEAEGGQPFLDLVATVTQEEVRAAADAYLLPAARKARRIDSP